MLFKRIVCLVSAAALLLASSGCRNKEDQNGFSIVASFTPVYALTLAVTRGADGVNVSSMAEVGGGCIHDYQLTTADMRAVESADVFIINGNGMEEGILSDIVSAYPNLAIIDSGLKVDRLIYEDGDSGEYNPHTWLNIENAVAQVDAIAENLSLYDAKNAAIYQKNAADFKSRATALLNEYLPLFEDLPRRDIVIFHESFAYTADELGLNVAAVISESEDGSLSPRELRDVTARVQDSGIKAVFCEPQFPSSAAENIAAETGAKLYELDAAVTGEPGPDFYLNAMGKNFSVLYKALSE